MEDKKGVHVLYKHMNAFFVKYCRMFCPGNNSRACI